MCEFDCGMICVYLRKCLISTNSESLLLCISHTLVSNCRVCVSLCLKSGQPHTELSAHQTPVVSLLFPLSSLYLNIHSLFKLSRFLLQSAVNTAEHKCQTMDVTSAEHCCSELDNLEWRIITFWSQGLSLSSSAGRLWAADGQLCPALPTQQSAVILPLFLEWHLVTENKYCDCWNC